MKGSYVGREPFPAVEKGQQAGRVPALQKNVEAGRIWGKFRASSCTGAVASEASADLVSRVETLLMVGRTSCPAGEEN